MDLLDFIRWLMNGTDWLGLIVAATIGYLAGFFMPTGWWSILTSMLVSYHLFLAWLVLRAEKQMEMVRPLGYPVTIHLVCLVLVVSLGAGRLIVPHFDVVCCGVAVLAFFERDWLFQTGKATAPNERSARRKY